MQFGTKKCSMISPNDAIIIKKNTILNKKYNIKNRSHTPYF